MRFNDINMFDVRLLLLSVLLYNIEALYVETVPMTPRAYSSKEIYTPDLVNQDALLNKTVTDHKHAEITAEAYGTWPDYGPETTFKARNNDSNFVPNDTTSTYGAKTNYMHNESVIDFENSTYVTSNATDVSTMPDFEVDYVEINLTSDRSVGKSETPSISYEFYRNVTLLSNNRSETNSYRDLDVFNNLTRAYDSFWNTDIPTTNEMRPYPEPFWNNHKPATNGKIAYPVPDPLRSRDNSTVTNETKPYDNFSYRNISFDTTTTNTSINTSCSNSTNDTFLPEKETPYNPFWSTSPGTNVTSFIQFWPIVFDPRNITDKATNAALKIPMDHTFKATPSNNKTNYGTITYFLKKLAGSTLPSAINTKITQSNAATVTGNQNKFFYENNFIIG